MALDRGEAIGKVRMAYEMEESVSRIVTELCKSDSLMDGLSDDVHRSINATLSCIGDDAQNHRRILSCILEAVFKRKGNE